MSLHPVGTTPPPATIRNLGAVRELMRLAGEKSPIMDPTATAGTFSDLYRDQLGATRPLKPAAPKPQEAVAPPADQFDDDQDQGGFIGGEPDDEFPGEPAR